MSRRLVFDEFPSRQKADDFVRAAKQQHGGLQTVTHYEDPEPEGDTPTVWIVKTLSQVDVLLVPIVLVNRLTDRDNDFLCAAEDKIVALARSLGARYVGVANLRV
jgi:hypothetical protein